ncbi:MAG: hypothetical protein M2R45_03977 [Verrucomicrobia subdivision 3 bacterium]|nr:hypothetical protein [Limisphaerales bacterium]MCS1415503.1 hypothetical protein [Limisphaerales bacterium]
MVDGVISADLFAGLSAVLGAGGGADRCAHGFGDLDDYGSDSSGAATDKDRFRIPDPWLFGRAPDAP